MSKEDELRNPITGQAPNSFTKVTNRQLPPPRNVRGATEMDPADRSRLARAHRLATEPSAENSYRPGNAPVTGYGKPEGIDDRTWSWMTGAHHMFPNSAAENGEYAIDEPHEAHPGVTVQRRAEDLSGKEYRKGEATLANYGHDERDPVGSLVRTQRQNLHRVIGEHLAAGVEENASQHFYGGNQIQTQIPDREMQRVHEEGVTEAHGRFLEGTHKIATHPDFQEATPHMTHRERLGAATNVMAQSTADTSPNNRWRQSSRWPNIEQAEESATAGVEQRAARHIGGRPQNTEKAARRVGEMVHGAHGFADEEHTGTGERFAPHSYGDPITSAKTVSFRGALIDQNAADAYKVSDVHEGGQILPGAMTAKATHYRDSSGNRVVHYPDQPESHVAGLEPEINEKTGKQDRGNARAEDMINQGKSTVHALNDYATRQVLSEHGLSRGVNYADNVHATQAAQWGSQQVRRTDPQMADVSHASQYPVVRNWAAEGSAEGIRPEFRHMFEGVSGNFGPQFVRNPNTSGTHNPMRRAYPLEKELGEQ